MGSADGAGFVIQASRIDTWRTVALPCLAGSMRSVFSSQGVKGMSTLNESSEDSTCATVCLPERSWIRRIIAVEESSACLMARIETVFGAISRNDLSQPSLPECLESMTYSAGDCS